MEVDKFKFTSIKEEPIEADTFCHISESFSLHSIKKELIKNESQERSFDFNQCSKTEITKDNIGKFQEVYIKEESILDAECIKEESNPEECCIKEESISEEDFIIENSVPKEELCYIQGNEPLGGVNSLNEDTESSRVGNLSSNPFPITVADEALETTRKKRFTCSQCGFSTHRKDTFKRHLLTHSEVKHFSCSLSTDIQRKWKSLRDSYRRELTLSKKGKSGSGAGSGRKEYLYFKQLSFLQDICATKPHAAESVEGDERENPGEPAPSTSNVKRKKSTVQSDEKIILEALAKKASVPHDHDTDFLLGLVPDFKSIPESVKFDAKLEIMNVIKRYKPHPNHLYFTSYQQTVPSPYSQASHTSHNFAPSIMHAQSTVPQSQPVLPCTPSPAQLSETPALS